jgi:hypothetical protein
VSNCVTWFISYFIVLVTFFLFHSLYSLLCCSFLPLDIHPYKTNLIMATGSQTTPVPVFLVSTILLARNVVTRGQRQKVPSEL